MNNIHFFKISFLKSIDLSNYANIPIYLIDMFFFL